MPVDLANFQMLFWNAAQARILQNLDHPHILRIFSWYEDGDSINIVAASVWKMVETTFLNLVVKCE